MGRFNQKVRNKRKIKVSNYHEENNIGSDGVQEEISKAYSRELKFTIFSIFIAIIVMITGSFSIFSSIQKSEKYNTLTVGSLKVDFNDKDGGLGNIINLNGAYPESDADGLNETPYSFKITNSGTVSASYIIKILDDGDMIASDGCSGNLLDKSNIKVSINGGAPFILGEKEVNSFIVGSGQLEPNNSEVYDIRMWIKEDADNSILGKHYHGKIVIESQSNSQNKNSDGVYAYNQTDETVKCITGNEETCQESKCTESKDVGSCAPGTIIKYKVNETVAKYFYVLHDDGEQMTLIERESTSPNVAWNSDANNTSGPKSVLSSLESRTATWVNVKEQTYVLGSTAFSGNSNTGCNGTTCDINTYTMDRRSGRARLISIQELVALGCGDLSTCPAWIYADQTNQGYWTLNANSTNNSAYYMSNSGVITPGDINSTLVDGRAVVVIVK